MRKFGCLICIFSLFSNLLLGCAPRPESIRPSHVQPELFSQLDCKQITFQRQSHSADLASISDIQNSEANADAAYFWVGLLLFWPAWFGFAATDDYSNDIARLKGETDALEAAYLQRCVSDQTEPTMSERSKSELP